MTLYDIVGLTGVTLSIYAYARLQWQRDYAKKLSYSICNLLSALFIGFSFFQSWNLSAFIINLAWAYISIYGLYRCLKYGYKARKAKRAQK